MVRDTRLRAGLSQEAAAELLGVGRVAISRAETGARIGAVVGALQYLVASWPELDDAARQRVRDRLARMREAEAIGQVSGAAGRLDDETHGAIGKEE